ncbi:MAG TPA: ABC transporter substrate-binding protein, partial [Thermodesulfobacteriota bacterium]
VIKVVTTSSSPPHGFLDAKTNSLKGIMVEVAQAVGRRLGVSVEFTEVPFGSLIPTLTSGRADLMSAPLFITPQRAEAVDFSDPVYGWGEGLAVRTDSAKTYDSLQSLSGSTAGVLVNSVQYNLVKDVPGVKDVRTYPDYVQLLADLRAGRIDVAMVDPPSIAYQMKLHGITGVRLVEGYTPVNAWKIGMAVNKGDRELLGAVNASLREMKADGELKRILDGWDVGHLIAR